VEKKVKNRGSRW